MKHLCRLLVIYASHKPVYSSHASAHTEKLACPTVLVSAKITGGSLYTRPLTSTEQLENYGGFSCTICYKNILLNRNVLWSKIFSQMFVEELFSP